MIRLDLTHVSGVIARAPAGRCPSPAKGRRRLAQQVAGDDHPLDVRGALP